VAGKTALTARDKSNWGKRADGTDKGEGWLGVLDRPDGKVSSEISVGVELDGQEVEIPTLVPTLDKSEVQYLLENPINSTTFNTPVGKSIMGKAVEHARRRLSTGQSPFAD